MAPDPKRLRFHTFNTHNFKLLLISDALWGTTPMRHLRRARHRRWGVLPEVPG